MNSKKNKIIVVNIIVFLCTFFLEIILQKNVYAEEPTYLICINRAQSCITLYKTDDKGEYTVAVKAMVCSSSADVEKLPIGTFTVTGRSEWSTKDNLSVRYVVTFDEGKRINSSTYREQNASTLVVEDFNRLGEAYTDGDVRLCVADAKWIYDNCLNGTLVKVYEDLETASPLGKPDMIKIPTSDSQNVWDPSDESKDNPWNKKNVIITGAGNKRVTVGTEADLLENVKGYDTCGNDITKDIYIIGEYDLKKIGVYTITYCLSDALGKKTTVDCELNVNDGTIVEDSESSEDNSIKITIIIGLCIISSAFTYIIMKKIQNRVNTNK